MQVQAEDPNIIYEVTLPLRPYREGSSAWLSPSVERPIIGAVLDERVRHPGHLGGYRGERLTPKIPVEWVSRDLTHELIAEVVLTLTYGNLTCQPKRATKPRVTVL